MLAFLRQSRALALALVLLAPGIAGSAVQWLHTCPADSPSAVTEHQQHDSKPSDSGHAPACHCIGVCHHAGVVSPAKPLTIAFAPDQPDSFVTPPSGVSFLPAGTPSDLLPPATAPPA
ncbi:MAG TPA: hypothetical protein VGQ24_05355 [Gemmatimonadales bacterium]|nr:hypothetical protein [Gemmatimonadales bacterium]